MRLVAALLLACLLAAVPRSVESSFTARTTSASTFRAAAAFPPQNDEPPVVAGTAASGETLTAEPGTWRRAAGYAFHWERRSATGWEPIAGAAGSSYALTAADIGSPVRVVVTASNAGGEATATSAPTGEVAGAGPLNTRLPVVVGTPEVSKSLIALDGQWDPEPASTAHQWERCAPACAPIAGATASTYRAEAADLGSALRVRVTAIAAAGGRTSAVSAATAPVAAAPFDLGTNGPVEALTRAPDGTLYAGGSFSAVGRSTGSALVASGATAAVAAAPGIDGTTRDVVPDGTGGAYIGGSFTFTRGGLTYDRLVRMRPDGTLDPSFRPAFDGSVSLVRLIGGRLYVSGTFANVNGQPRTRLVAFDVATGALTAFNPRLNDVASEIVADGSTLYLGGAFTTVGGQARGGLAAVDADTGALRAFNPGANGPVNGLALDRAAGTLYFGGSFGWIGGMTARSRLASVRTDGTLTSWAPSVNGAVSKLSLSGSTLYVAGSFTSAGGASRTNAAAFDVSAGTLTAWNPAPNGAVNDIGAVGGRVHLAGAFTTVAGQARSAFAIVDAGGAATPWAATPFSASGLAGHSIARDGDALYLGGQLHGLHSVRREGVVAFDSSGEVQPWAPAVPGGVLDIEVDGTTVYLGGAFTSVAGQSRSRLAAVGTDGALRAFNPAPNGLVRELEVSGSAVYVAGDFTSIANGVRSRAAALAPDGSLEPWNPQPGGRIDALAVDGGTVYLGGGFTSVAGVGRSRVAAVDAATGALTGWNPGVDGVPPGGALGAWVHSIEVDSGTVFVGGNFATAGGAARNRLAAVGTDGTVRPFNPNVDGGGVLGVAAIGVTPEAVYLGGHVSSVAGQPRSLASVDRATGALHPWASHGPDATALVASPAHVFLAGSTPPFLHRFTR